MVDGLTETLQRESTGRRFYTGLIETAIRWYSDFFSHANGTSQSQNPAKEIDLGQRTINEAELEYWERSQNTHRFDGTSEWLEPENVARISSRLHETIISAVETGQTGRLKGHAQLGTYFVHFDFRFPDKPNYYRLKLPLIMKNKK